MTSVVPLRPLRPADMGGNRQQRREVAGTKAAQGEGIARRAVTALARRCPRWRSLGVPTASHFHTLTRGGVGAAVALTGALHWAFWVCGLIGLAAIPITLLLVRGEELAGAVPRTHPALRAAD
jgi:hypothetical protein